MGDFSPYLRGGALRADSITGLHPEMRNALGAMLADAPNGLTINSAYRSPELQATLYEQALERYGSEAEARRWVAPPGRSQHNHGSAVDLGFAGDAARAWAHENAANYGLSFPLANENWHLELAGARDGIDLNAMARQAVEATGGTYNQGPAGFSTLANRAVAAFGGVPQIPQQQRNMLAQLNPDMFLTPPGQFMQQNEL